MIYLGLLLGVCTVGVVAIIVFAQLGIGPALIAAALMTIAVGIIALSLNKAIGS